MTVMTAVLKAGVGTTDEGRPGGRSGGRGWVFAVSSLRAHNPVRSRSDQGSLNLPSQKIGDLIFDQAKS